MVAGCVARWTAPRPEPRRARGAGRGPRSGLPSVRDGPSVGVCRVFGRSTRETTVVWQRRAKHCPMCGASLAVLEVEGRERVCCGGCSFVLYENLAVFLCRPIGGDLKPGHDALDARWFDLARLPANLGFDNGPRILDRLRGG